MTYLQQRPAATSIATYAKSIPVVNDDGYTLVDLVNDIMGTTNGNLSSNTTVIPVLQTLKLLLEAEALESLANATKGKER